MTLSPERPQPIQTIAGPATNLIDLRCGRYQDVLRDIEYIDHLITDPPFSGRTHSGQRHGRKDARYCNPNSRPILSARGHQYTQWSDAEINELVESWAPRTRGWICIFASHDLVHTYECALERVGRYVFAPVPCVLMHSNVRLAGDGPSSWSSYLVVARPRLRKGIKRWGTLPGAYVGKPFDVGENMLDRSKRICTGSKPLWLMRAIVRDYSRAGDFVCDPCAGGATTLIAAHFEGRRSVGSEAMQSVWRKAERRIENRLTRT